MRLSGLHLLLTYQCTFECDHCFVFGSPWQHGTMSFEKIREILKQAKELGGIEWIYFEGGEPFLYYAVLCQGVQLAHEMGFQVGIVTNGYWATDTMDAREWLRPFVGKVQDLSFSGDLYHGGEDERLHMEAGAAAAKELGIPNMVITIAQPEQTCAATSGQLPSGEHGVVFRGRAAEKLVSRATGKPWDGFTECPAENLRDPGRVHVDPLGNIHLCQGIVVGNMFQTPLREICASFDPDGHPIVGPILKGGPTGLVTSFGCAHEETYADACHLCYETRGSLRSRFPESLGPDQVYGVMS